MPPKRIPISGKLELVSSRDKNMATMRGLEMARMRLFPLRSETLMEK